MWITGEIIRTCRTPELQTHAAGPQQQMNTAPWYNSHQSSINFPFLCLQQCIKRVIHQSSLSSLPLTPPAAPPSYWGRKPRGGARSLESRKESCERWSLARWRLQFRPGAVARTDEVSGSASAPTQSQRQSVSTPLGTERAERSRRLLIG